MAMPAAAESVVPIIFAAAIHAGPVILHPAFADCQTGERP